MDRELADDRLAGPGGRRDEDAVTGLQRLARLDLERVEREPSVDAKAAKLALLTAQP